MAIKTVKGVPARVKDEKAYGVAIQEQIIRPILSEVLIDFENAPRVGRAWIDAVENKIIEIQQNETFGEETATEALNHLRAYHKAKMIKSFSAAMGIDINPFMSDLGIRVDMTQALQENISLIKSIPEKSLNQVYAEFDNILTTKGFDEQALLKSLSDRFKVSQSRAEFIARDQTQKIIGNLNRVRQKNLGINEYIWQHMGDERVVGNPAGLYPEGNPGHMDHWIRNGVRFSWDAPPPDGHPGNAFNCRCIALAVVE